MIRGPSLTENRKLGRTCLKCGFNVRLIKTGRCCFCQQLAVNKSQRERYKNDPEWKKKKDEASSKYNMDRYNTDPIYKAKMLEAAKARHLERYATDIPYRDAMRKKNKARYRELYYTDPEFRLKRILRAKERKRKLTIRTPAWADKHKILDIYKEAQELGMTVDHIIPIKGKLVSGLHVHENLQLLSSQDNMAKSNKFNIEEFV